MKSSFQLDMEWLGKDSGPAEERASFASIGIFVSEQAATQVEDSFSKSVRESVRLSAYPLAQWFAANLWRILYEPLRNSLDWHLSHNIAGVGGGYIWPDLLLYGAGGGRVAVEMTRSTPNVHEPVRYLSEFTESIPTEVIEDELFRFCEIVRDRLCDCKVDVGEFHSLLAMLREEAVNPEERQWRKIEALLGFDRNDAPEMLVENIAQAFPRWGRAATEEVVAAYPQEAEQKFLQIENLIRNAPQGTHPPYIAEVSIQLRQADSYEPWRRGEIAAQAARRQMGLNGGPISNNVLAELMGLPPYYLDDASSMPQRKAGVSVGFSDPDGFKIHLDKHRATGRRFDLARILGDLIIMEPSDRASIATNSAMARQKFQRSFAQEFLCPGEAIVRFLPEPAPREEDIEDAAAYFGVSPLCIETTLVNRGIRHRHHLARFRDQ